MVDARSQRYLQAGALAAISLSDIGYLKSRYTVASAPATVNSPWGKAQSFDGTDDKVVVGAIAGTVKTVVLHVYLETTTEQLLDFDSGTNYLSASAGTLSVATLGDEVLYVDGVQTATITASGWHSVAFTTATGLTISNLQIATDNTSFGQIRVSEVLCFDRALSITEISDIHKGQAFDYEKDVVSAYDMSTINPTDIGFRGNQNHGTGTGLVAATDIVEGIASGKAIEFNGTDEAVQVTGAANFTTDIAEELSVVCWIKIDQLPSVKGSEESIIGFSGGTNARNWQLTAINSAGDKLRFRITSGAAGQNAQTTCPSINEWHQVGGIYKNGVTVGVILDGEILNIQTPSIVLSMSVKDMAIGAYGDPPSLTPFEGTIDKTILFNKILTTLKARDLYERQRRGKL